MPQAAHDEQKTAREERASDEPPVNTIFPSHHPTLPLSVVAGFGFRVAQLE